MYFAGEYTNWLVLGWSALDWLEREIVSQEQLLGRALYMEALHHEDTTIISHFSVFICLP